MLPRDFPVPIVGDRPESGVRIALERPRDAEDPPWIYAGEAALPEAVFPLRVTIAADGKVVADVLPSADGRAEPPDDLAEKVRLIMRTVFKQGQADGEPPARRVVRWRAVDGPSDA